MNWYNVFKFLHIVSVVAMVGGIFARQIVRGVAKKSNDPKEISALTHVAHRLDRIMVIPGANMAIIFGIILAIILKWPIFGFLQGADKNWLLVSNLLIVLSMALVVTVFIPHNKKLEALVETAIAEGHVTPELRMALNERNNEWAHHVEEIGVLSVAALMVLKPF
jgi:uncharacterized membrane protein